MRSLQRRCALASLVAMSVGAGCDGGTGPEFENPPHHVFHGVVTNQAANPVAGALVTATHHSVSCDGPATFSDHIATALNGTYRLDFRLLYLSDPVSCVALEFAATGYRTDSVVVENLAFKRGSPTDSTRSDVVLQAVQYSWHRQ